MPGYMHIRDHFKSIRDNKMAIILVGLNYRTAPIELREQLSLTHCALQMALQEIGDCHNADGEQTEKKSQIPGSSLAESVILSTCNRHEIYASASDAEKGRSELEDFLSKLEGIPPAQLRPHLYFLKERQTLEHLMRVAAGMESMILGEPQILGQVIQAFLEAQKAYRVGPIICQAFSRAIRVGKRARNETDIGRYTTSVGHAGVRLIEQEVKDLSKTRALLVGAGEMAILALRTLTKHGAKQIRIINRSFPKASQLAKEGDCEAVSWYHLADAMAWADVILTATDAPHTVIKEDDVRQVFRRREGRPLLFVDIAFPRDVDPEVRNLDNVQLIDIDALQTVVDEHVALRQSAIPQVEEIIEEEIEDFYAWLNSRQVVPVIVDLRRKIKSLIDEELEETIRRLKNLDPEDRDIIKRMAHRLSNQILHDPTSQLKAHAANGNGFEFADVVRQLFNLDRGR